MAEEAVDQEQQTVGENPAGHAEGYSWPLAARVVLALAGSYVMAAVVAMGLARGLAVTGLTIRSEATAIGTLVGMLLWPSTIVYVFAANNLKRSTIIIVGITALSAVIALIAGQPTS